MLSSKSWDSVSCFVFYYVSLPIINVHFLQYLQLLHQPKNHVLTLRRLSADLPNEDENQYSKQWNYGLDTCEEFSDDFFVESKQFWIEDHHWSTASGSLSKLSSVESTPLAVWVAQILFDYWLQIVVFSMQIWDSATSEISKQSKNNIQVITRFFVVIMRVQVIILGRLPPARSGLNSTFLAWNGMP